MVTRPLLTSVLGVLGRRGSRPHALAARRLNAFTLRRQSAAAAHQVPAHRTRPELRRSLRPAA